MKRHPLTPTQRQGFLTDAETGKSINCTIPKCRRKAKHIHHIIAVCDGGGNESANLMMLCETHHVNLHKKQNDFMKWGRLGGLATAATQKSFKNLKQFRNKDV